MKREIKFRGYDSTNRRWIYGDLTQVKDSGLFFIGEDNMDCTNVRGDSVGQFTGLKDKSGVDIYEGDIVRWDDCSKGRHWRIAVVRINPDIQFDCSLGLSYDGMKSSSKDTFRFGNFIYKDTHNHLEVIGNISDSPELLKGGCNE